MNNLAHGYFYASRVGEALTLHEQTLKARKAKLGPDATDTLISMGNLASTYQAAGRLGDAIPSCRKRSSECRSSSDRTTLTPWPP